MTIAVLGSSGQIGTYLIEYLRNAGHLVTGYDIIPNLKTTAREVDLRCNKIDLSQYDFVYFLAFDVGGSTYLNTYQHTSTFMNNNMYIMANIFDELQRTKVPFMFTSSQMANMSHSPYGLLKHIGELNTKSLGGLVTKFWNVYGIENDPEKAHVITDFINKAKRGRIDMMTDGTEARQFLYAEDCCECLDILVSKYDEIDRDQELHITNFQWHTILEVATLISHHFPDCKIEPSAQKDIVQQDVRNEPNNYVLDHWKPKTSLVTGIEKVVASMTA